MASVLVEGHNVLQRMPVFAVTTIKGPRWDDERGIREQELWDEHAQFADGLVAAGRFVFGGPVEADDDRVIALLAVDAPDAPGVHALFADRC